MTIGAGAAVAPLAITDAAKLHLPWIAMLASLALVIVLAAPDGRLGRARGVLLLAAYGAFVAVVLSV